MPRRQRRLDLGQGDVAFGHSQFPQQVLVCDNADGTVAGYVSLSAAQIERAHLPKSAQRNRPDPLPALLLGQLAINHRH